ncbi:MAG: ECF-type sigma factor [Planctomycetota bacterium]
MRLVGRRVGRKIEHGDATEGESESNDAYQDDTVDGSSWDSRGHFFAAAAESMRRILIDHARRKNQLKRGGGEWERVEMDNVHLATIEKSIDLLALDEALAKLEAEDESKARVVKLRYFAGLTIEQTAKAMGVSEPTVKRHWFYARAWLRREMGHGNE